MIRQQIEALWRQGLCSGCGTCAGICPFNIIRMHTTDRGTYVPVFGNEQCLECHLCKDVCPSYSPFARKDLGEAGQSWLIGKCLECYVGSATDHVILSNASSGGLATALAASLLESKIVNGVVVTRMDKNHPLKPQVFVARNRGDLISASGSKYCPVPLNIAIKNILNEKTARFAVVGLPCHIQGLRNAERVSRELKNRITLHIGLFCSHTVNFLGTKFLLQKMKIKPQDAVKINYRGEGRGNYLQVKLVNNSERRIPMSAYWGCFFSMFFIPKSCTLCLDATSEMADVSVGDMWLREFRPKGQLMSTLVVRTEVGREAVNEAVKRGEIRIQKIDPKYAILSQKDSVIFKKRSVFTRLAIMKIMGQNIPRATWTCCSCTKQTFFTFLNTILLYFNIYASASPSFRRLLRHIPLSILRLYKSIFDWIAEQE